MRKSLPLLVILAGFALFGVVVATIKPSALWNPHVWWQSIAVWFAAAIVVHDLVLFPLYTLADRLLRVSPAGCERQPRVLNHIRLPVLGSALTLLVFLPGIIEQGKPTYLAATGQTQEPFLARWLLLSAAMFGLSAVIFAVRFALAHRRSAASAVRADATRTSAP